MKSKHLFSTGVAIVAAVAVAAPAWAQTEGGNSYGGNSMGIPGPNPGGPYIPGTIDGGLFGHTPSPPRRLRPRRCRGCTITLTGSLTRPPITANWRF